MVSFFKRLFGGKPAPAPAPVAAPVQPDAEAILAETRRTAALYDRRNDPQDWANAQQILANNICSVSAEQPPARAAALLGEAVEILGEAIEVAGRDAVPAFRASMLRLRGECAWRQSAHRQGDGKGRLLADAANWLGEATELCPPEVNRTLWVDAQLFRGACLQDLALLKGGGEQSLGWLDEAAACFDAVADRAVEGGLHPIGAYNAYVVREQRAKASGREEARGYFEEARRRLVQAMADPALQHVAADSAKRLAALDAALR